MAVFRNEDEHLALQKRTALELQARLSTYAAKCCQHPAKVSSENEASFSSVSLLQAILSDKSLQSFAIASASATSREALRNRFQRALGTESADAGKSGTYASLYHVMALATVLKKKITLVYPDRNPALRQFLNVSVDPVAVVTSTTRASPGNVSNEIVVMWTQIASGSPNDQHWSPNHFVPLLPAKKCAGTEEKTGSPQVSAKPKQFSVPF